jgi:putative ABC transport system ATP-binding protein
MNMPTAFESRCLLSLRDVSRSYSVGQTQVAAMAGVNLQIAKGEQVAIVGPSGSGKSTLMNILGMLERPSAGEYYFDGSRVADLSSGQKAEIRSRSVGFVFQQFHLIPHLSAAQNVELPLRYQYISARERAKRVADSLHDVGLGHRLDHRPPQLSGGERQRVAIARALVSRPKLILADEPTGALDSANGHAVLELMLALASQIDVTLLLITHDTMLAERLPRCVRLLDGRIQSDTYRADQPASARLPGATFADPV